MKSVVLRSILLIALVGCGSSQPILPVEGLVTLDERPLEGATVIFLPVEEKTVGQRGSGRTGADGKFTVVGTNGQKGLVAGDYRVTISKVRSSVGGDGEGGAFAEGAGSLDLPPIYSDPTQTVLKAGIPGEGKPLVFSLSSRPKK